MAFNHVLVNGVGLITNMFCLCLFVSALQACLSFIGERGVTVKFIELELNMYTVPALLAAVCGLINMLLVLIVLR